MIAETSEQAQPKNSLFRQTSMDKKKKEIKKEENARDEGCYREEHKEEDESLTG
jgi:hypothetical protein